MWKEDVKVPDTPKCSCASILRVNETLGLKFLAANLLLVQARFIYKGEKKSYLQNIKQISHLLSFAETQVA